MCNKGYDNKEHGCKTKCHNVQKVEPELIGIGSTRKRARPVLLTADLIDSIRIQS